MALSEVFVDSTATGSNDGTSLADAYTSLQNAVDNTTLGANGTRFNVKGTQVLTKPIDFTSGFSGTPSASQPVVFQGVTATPGDGGECELDGTTNSVDLMRQDVTSLSFVNCYFHSDSTSDHVWTPGPNGFAWGCRFNVAVGLVDWDPFGSQGVLAYCNILYNQSGVSTTTRMNDAQNNNSSNLTIFCYIECGPNAGTAISRGIAVGNILNMSNGLNTGQEIIDGNGNRFYVAYNSIYGDGACDGIYQTQSNSEHIFLNNYLENCGTGIISEGDGVAIAIGNKFYDCSTNIDFSSKQVTIEQDNNTVASSGFTNAAGGDFTPTSVLKDIGFPSSFYGLSGNPSYPGVGAIQAAVAGAGGSAFMNRGILTGGRL